MNIRVGCQTVIGRGILETLQEAIRLRGQCFEIFFDGFLPLDISSSRRNQIYRIARNRDLLLTVHAPLLSLLEKENADSIAETFTFTTGVRAKVLTIHADPNYKEFSPKLLEFIHQSQLEECGVKISIENTPATSPQLLNQIVEEIRGDFKKIGVTFDIGHAYLHILEKRTPQKSLQEYLAQLNGPIYEVHAHANNGQEDTHWSVQKFSERVDMNTVFEYLIQKKNFNGPIILEYWRENMKKDLDYLDTMIKGIRVRK